MLNGRWRVFAVEIESGNTASVDTQGTGWFIGFSEWTRNAPSDGHHHPAADLRFMPRETQAQSLQVKWMVHPVGDPRGESKPISNGRTISILVSETGRFHLEFAPDAGFDPARVERHLLRRHGDFLIWGAGLHHRWWVEETCTILTLRWVPIAQR